jgi:hypothetical protein
MADLKRGREIFTQRVEYPLPAKPGVKDYVFYFVEAKGYGLGARKFMGRHYKNHIAKDASSLEQMFALLHAEIASGQVTQIRELALVAHGNAVQLFFPILNAAQGVDPVYNCLTEYSISQLQVDMKAGQFASMSQARKEVAARMLDDSWVTIRACNVGKSGKILYALYALFGGRANVYAPTQYMFFGDCAVGPDQRVTTKFGVYDYLVKQHFLATSEHTLQRQAAIITDLLDPESYSMPFVLASAQPTGGNAADLAAYSKLVDELNAFRLSDDMRARFQAQGFALSAGASVVRSARFTNIDVPQRAVWFILDRTVQSDGANYDLVYEIHDQPGTGDQPTDTLEARARIASLVSSNASFPFQLFFDQDTDDEFKGIVVRLAGYADGGDVEGQVHGGRVAAQCGALDGWHDRPRVRDQSEPREDGSQRPAGSTSADPAGGERQGNLDGRRRAAARDQARGDEDGGRIPGVLAHGLPSAHRRAACEGRARGDPQGRTRPGRAGHRAGGLPRPVHPRRA